MLDAVHQFAQARQELRRQSQRWCCSQLLYSCCASSQAAFGYTPPSEFLLLVLPSECPLAAVCNVPRAAQQEHQQATPTHAWGIRCQAWCASSAAAWHCNESCYQYGSVSNAG